MRTRQISENNTSAKYVCVQENPELDISAIVRAIGVTYLIFRINGHAVFEPGCSEVKPLRNSLHLTAVSNLSSLHSLFETSTGVSRSVLVSANSRSSASCSVPFSSVSWRSKELPKAARKVLTAISAFCATAAISSFDAEFESVGVFFKL